jgi:uncharacterized protein (DUF2342 family)
MPDIETPVAALSALLTVLTFVGGFVTVRLHGAYREAVAEERNLRAALAAREHTEAFPEARLEAHYEDMQRALNALSHGLPSSSWRCSPAPASALP